MVRPLAPLLILALAACNQSGTGGSASAPSKPAAYTYPPPVKGKYSEINSGKFDLVDGIAKDANGGTVVYVTEKQIASPALADSTCAMAQARSLALLRNSGYIQVRLNADGSASYFEAGTPYHGQMIDLGGPRRESQRRATLCYPRSLERIFCATTLSS